MILPLLRSAVIPVEFSHGFTTRAGGVSQGCYESLNVGGSWGDLEHAVATNRSRVVAASRCERFFMGRQVHGAEVAVISERDAPEAMRGHSCDGLVTAQPGTAVAVLVADCVPIVLADPETGACAAVHAGWRGTFLGVARVAVEQLQRQFGVKPRNLCAALGPSIGPCCFEVGDDVVAAAHATLGDQAASCVTVSARGKPHVNLWRSNTLILEAAGLRPEAIDALGCCTMCDPTRFFSYRRQGRATGQHLGFIGRPSS
ncbi:MAG: peptidoglycan editing factor PgeF [Deltaproteobacteria bacterium]|nr:peptidoglycan editing factor PgeF [Deltaproteobacteria bacterium]